MRPAAPVAWLVRSSSPQLAAALNHWLAKNDTRLLAMALPKPPSSSPRMRVTKRTRKSVHPSLGEMEGAAHYQSLFNRYAREVNWDWRLLAAQAYQESGFDPQAVSWMGAQGLMQLMPSTARSFGVHNVFDPEQNLRGATAFIKTLQQRYSSIPADERINFILAAYNAGPGHIDDARSLAKKKGLNADVWQGNVADIVLRMSDASYYNDPVCRHGYFRGSETYNYVNDIQARWAVYRSKVR